MSTDSRNWTKVKLNINFTKPTKINKIFRTDGYRGANWRYFVMVLNVKYIIFDMNGRFSKKKCRF